MENVEARRRAREAFKDIQLSIDHILFKVPHAGLKMEVSCKVNSRGLEGFSNSWLPETRPKAVVYFCHGYGDTCTFLAEGLCLAKAFEVSDKLILSFFKTKPIVKTVLICRRCKEISIFRLCSSCDGFPWIWSFRRSSWLYTKF
ncbi:uncharacterized protein LOC132046642 [Lycium ferocissimum]|uniref:uncharacterized protein LOC132046642 n=1 Tax=Lycium ferocissimum TaxID=112874 RepID=UPI00281559DE|nr:uncharacterized protein LOC132046642 [Lycium ferocissimum]XP_059293318.1 uncharacterized protein LOC132046642 [Lycium ferocissimum]XP_059293319.1 uncharacterized protein LOC132046642 [Lycium ferocissimum]XP_059293321.1 uncharacterized protein LOC132046642 [Lycium ferocissimum]XP_059293322.1 uncharacterized protein LOC132046642 [Lycium ferocissimum]